MVTATIRDLRTRFPMVRRLIEQEGEVVVTHRGRPVVVLRPYEERPVARGGALDYWARLRRRMPRPLTAGVRRALDEASRGER
ncbi:MAG: type II toxin-antitoxin system prevent-host-death family antitoxin [Deltaproteobacteria bacterium]|nr:type II toxin-antitoxin system prevent-host-death family antitoxin [Deltaproteobacteria bacterium]